MKVDVVADVGNSRIKWGRCAQTEVATTVSLPADEPTAWQEQLRQWQVAEPLSWAVASVQPASLERLVLWLEKRGHRVRIVRRANELPLQVDLEHPDRVGIDRLLNAVAANRNTPAAHPAIIVDAGSAVTVDWLDKTGRFKGGAIFPGLRLMAKALHEHTALLPMVEIDSPSIPLPGTSTIAAIRAGVYHGTAGAINTLITLLGSQSPATPAIYLTGGDAALLQQAVDSRATLWPEMTLEGIRIAAEALP